MKSALVLVAVAAVAILLWFVVPRDGATLPDTGGAAKPAPAKQTPDEAPSARQAVSDETPVASVVGGIVLGPDGKPEASVRVDLLRVQSPWPALQTVVEDSVLTADDGRFKFGIEWGRDLRVVAKKSGLAPREVEVTPLDSELVLSMRHGYRVEGFVEAPFSRRIPDCEVLLEPVAFSARRALRTTTDRDGRFRFFDVPAGAARLTARHADYQPTTNPSVGIGTPEVFQLTFSKHPLRLSGLVTTAGVQPDPIGGAIVRMYPSGWNSRLFHPIETRTDDDGHFTLRGLGPGNFQLVVRHQDYSTRDRLVSLRDASSEVAVELVPRSRVEGRLLGDRVRKGIRLQIVQFGESRMRTAVEGDGSFAFDGKLSAGKAELTLLDDELCFDRTGSRSMTQDIEDGDTTRLELEVSPVSVVHGVVRGPEGAPVAGVRVLWRDPAAGPLAPPELLALTDAEGSYRARGLPRTVGVPGFSLATLVFQRHGFATNEARFAPIAPGETLELDPVTLVGPGLIDGRVTRDGKGVAGAVVFVGNGMSELDPEVSGPDGAFTLRDVAPGKYRVKAMHSTLPLAVSESVAVQSGATAGPIALELPAGRTLSGQVVAPDGSPVTNALIVVRGMRGAAFYGDANGDFTLEVPSADVELQVFGNTQLYEFAVHEIVRVPREQNYVRVTVPIVPCGTVVARVLALPLRKAVGGGVLRLRSLEDELAGDDGGARQRQRNVRGRWVAMNGGELRLESFPAGRSRFTLHCEGYAPLVKDVVVAAGDTVDLGEVLLERGAAVRGSVKNEAGEPVAGARVRLGDELDRIPRSASGTFTDADGGFEIQGVSPGSGTLVVVAEGYAPHIHELSIPGDLLRREPLPILLDRGATIVITVQDERTGEKDLNTVVLNKFGKMLDLARPDENGVARFEHRSPGAYEVEVFGEDDAKRQVLVKEPKTYELTIRLEQAR